MQVAVEDVVLLQRGDVNTAMDASAKARPPHMRRVASRGVEEVPAEEKVEGVWKTPSPSAAAVWAHRRSCVRQQKASKDGSGSRLSARACGAQQRGAARGRAGRGMEGRRGTGRKAGMVGGWGWGRRDEGGGRQRTRHWRMEAEMAAGTVVVMHFALANRFAGCAPVATPNDADAAPAGVSRAAGLQKDVENARCSRKGTRKICEVRLHAQISAARLLPTAHQVFGLLFSLIATHLLPKTISAN